MSGSEGSALSVERPFPGLRPFGAADHAFFFGRQTQVYALYRLVSRSHFSAVVGSSGSGKSSLVRAGLLPLLDEETREAAGRKWICVEMRPGDAPLDRLVHLLVGIAAELSKQDDSAIIDARKDRIAYRVRGSSFGIADALAEIPGTDGYSFVLLVDQFEELFRYSATGQSRDRAEETRSRDEAAHFVQLLLEASRSPGYDMRVLLTMRSDFIGDCARFQGLPEAVSTAQFLVPSLDRNQREEVIRGPIAKVGATIDAALVERLLNDSDEELDQLPVLQHCLLRLWEHASPSRDGPEPDARHIVMADYAEIGGMAGALSQHANEILTNDLPDLVPAVGAVFRALCEFDQLGRVTRRALSFDRLVAESGESEPNLRKVVDRFRADDCSFLTPSLSAIAVLDSKSRIDVGHESLLRRWERVSGEPGATGERDDRRAAGWLREERRDGQRYQVLLSMIENEAPGQALIAPDQMDRTAKWWNERPRTEAWTERWGGGRAAVAELITRSLAFRDEEEQRHQAVKAERRRTRRLVVAMSALCFLLVIVGGAGLIVWRQYQLAEQARKVAESQAEAAGQAMSIAVNAITDAYQRGAVTTDSAAAMLKNIQEATRTVPELTPLGASQKINLLLNISDAQKTLGKTKDALELVQQARRSAKQLADDEPNESKYQLLLYAVLFRLADATTSLDYSQTSLQQVLPLYQSAQTIIEDQLNITPEDGKLLFNLAFVTNKVGETYALLKDYPNARQQYSRALDAAGKLPKIDPGNFSWKALLASTQSKMGNLLFKLPTPDLEGALVATSNAIATQKDLLSAAPGDKVIVSNLAGSYRGRGDIMLRMGKKAEALGDYKASLQIVMELYDKDPKNTFWGIQLANTYIRIGDALAGQADLPGAIDQYQKAQDLWQTLTQMPSASPVWFDRLKLTQSKLAKLRAGQSSPTTDPATAGTPPAPD